MCCRLPLGHHTEESGTLCGGGSELPGWPSCASWRASTSELRAERSASSRLASACSMSSRAPQRPPDDQTQLSNANASSVAKLTVAVLPPSSASSPRRPPRHPQCRQEHHPHHGHPCLCRCSRCSAIIASNSPTACCSTQSSARTLPGAPAVFVSVLPGPHQKEDGGASPCKHAMEQGAQRCSQSSCRGRRHDRGTLHPFRPCRQHIRPRRHAARRQRHERAA